MPKPITHQKPYDLVRALARLMGYQVEEVAVDFPALNKEIPIIALRPRRPS